MNLVQAEQKALAWMYQLNMAFILASFTSLHGYLVFAIQ